MFTAKEIVSSELNRWLGDNSPLSGKARFWKMFEDNSKNCKWLSDEDVFNYVDKFLPAFGIYRYCDGEDGDKEMVVQRFKSKVKIIGFDNDPKVPTKIFRWTLDTIKYLQKNVPPVPPNLEECIHKKGAEHFNKWTFNFLPQLPKEETTDEEGKTTLVKCCPLLDKKDTVYMSFRNGIVKVTAEDTNFIPFSKFGIHHPEYFVWEENIIDCDFDIKVFKDGPKGHFWDFISNISKEREGKEWVLNEQQRQSIVSSYGYLLHNYYPPNIRKMVFLYDRIQIVDGAAEGGNGKSLLCQSLNKIKPYHFVDGKRAGDCSGRFLWSGYKPDKRIVLFSDITKKFTIKSLYNQISDGFEVEGKRKDTYVIPPESSPKIVVTSNYLIDSRDPSDSRRVFQVPIGNFYGWHAKKKITGGEEKELRDFHGGKLFFDEWIKGGEDWTDFYSTSLYCVQQYLKEGLVSFGDTERLNAERLKLTYNDPYLDAALSAFIIKAGTNKDGVFRSDVIDFFRSDLELLKYHEWGPHSKLKMFQELADSLGYEINGGQSRRQRINPKTNMKEDTYVLSKPTQTVGPEGDLTTLFEGGDWR